MHFFQILTVFEHNNKIDILADFKKKQMIFLLLSTAIVFDPCKIIHADAMNNILEAQNELDDLVHFSRPTYGHLRYLVNTHEEILKSFQECMKI